MAMPNIILNCIFAAQSGFGNPGLSAGSSLAVNPLHGNMSEAPSQVKTELKAAMPAGQPPKLLDQVRSLCRLKHYSIRTEQTYRQ